MPVFFDPGEIDLKQIKFFSLHPTVDARKLLQERRACLKDLLHLEVKPLLVSCVPK